MLYAFLVVFFIVDVVTVRTKNHYNFVSLAGIVFYLCLMFVLSVDPRKASAIGVSRTFFYFGR